MKEISNSIIWILTFLSCTIIDRFELAWLVSYHCVIQSDFVCALEKAYRCKDDVQRALPELHTDVSPIVVT